MTSTVESTPVAARRPLPWGLILTATLLAGGTVALIWMAAVPWGPLVCPAIYPAPRNCFAENRAGTGLIATIAVVLVALATILVAAIGRRRAWVIPGVIALALAPIVSYLCIAWMPGFPT